MYAYKKKTPINHFYRRINEDKRHYMGLSPEVQKKFSEGGNTMYYISSQQFRIVLNDFIWYFCLIMHYYHRYREMNSSLIERCLNTNGRLSLQMSDFWLWFWYTITFFIVLIFNVYTMIFIVVQKAMKTEEKENI